MILDSFSISLKSVILGLKCTIPRTFAFTSEATFTADENQKAIGQVTATDIEGDDITYSVSGSEISIAIDGTLTFIEAPDYETKTAHSATVTASDGVNFSEQSIIRYF